MPLFDPQELLTDEDYRFSMKMRRHDPAAFFAPSGNHTAILAERERWLRESPDRYVAMTSNALPLVQQLQTALKSWSGPAEAVDPGDGDAQRFVRKLGRSWEADFLVVTPADGRDFVLQLGCVCFPSSWALEEKIGQPLQSIHGVVPGLNREVGQHIQAFLQRMKPGVGWLRANWGISSSPERNQHPSRGLNRLTADTDPASTWLRIEHQLLVRLEGADAVLFGIRLENVSLAGIRSDPKLAVGLRRALMSMPEAMLRYKNLAEVRDPLIDYLTGTGVDLDQIA